MSRNSRWSVVLVPTLLVYFAPVPGLNPQQRHLMAVFAGTIISLVARPVAIGVSVLVAMTTLALTGTLPAARTLSGFSNITLWLIFTAFLFARAVTQTRLGLHVAYLSIELFGHSALTLGYSVVATDLFLAMFIPSDTARGGGIVFPIVRILSEAFDSKPCPTAPKVRVYLILIGFRTT